MLFVLPIFEIFENQILQINLLPNSNDSLLNDDMRSCNQTITLSELKESILYYRIINVIFFCEAIKKIEKYKVKSKIHLLFG